MPCFDGGHSLPEIAVHRQQLFGDLFAGGIVNLEQPIAPSNPTCARTKPSRDRQGG